MPDDLPSTPRSYRHGDKPNWEIVLDAVLSFDRPVSVGEVTERIVSDIPDFSPKNVPPDLSVLSVNCQSRGHHAVNSRVRRTDSGNAYDRLIRIGRGRGVLFVRYDPQIHGVWELIDVGDNVLKPRFVAGADGAELDEARKAAAEKKLFDPAEDARRRMLAAIVQREGQPAFRRQLLRAYDGVCAISGCAVEALLEAAHIVPYRGVHTNIAENGLLLRADLHKLFDLHLICIDPVKRTVHLAPELRRSEYACFEGVGLRAPQDPSLVASSEALRHHEERCGWAHEESD